MNALSLPADKVALGEQGLTFHADLSLEEWERLGSSVARLGRCAGFVVGDWLVYGESRFAKGDPEASGRYLRAMEATGLDLTTLRTYATVARRVPVANRRPALSWEHHKKVAKLPGDEQAHWLRTCEQARDQGQAVSTRRLAKSIGAGRLLQVEELTPPEDDRPIANHIPHINCLTAWWRSARDSGWLDRASPEVCAAMLRDFAPVMEILAAVRSRLKAFEEPDSRPEGIP